jgi:hypothetical protein
MKDRASKGKSKGITRRAIVHGAGVLAGAAAYAGHPLAAAERREAPSDDEDPRVLRYRETDHIRWFYRRARM